MVDLKQEAADAAAKLEAPAKNLWRTLVAVAVENKLLTLAIGALVAFVVVVVVF